MPAISMFYGIIIRMYNNGEHNPPHFHAIYQEYEASFNLNGDLIKGNIPKKQQGLVAAWTEIHKEELLLNWQLAEKKQELFKIEPLRWVWLGRKYVWKADYQNGA